jgi:type I restriction enzyme S subunit
MRGYPKYKPSGLSWISAIPKDWHLKKLKFKADIQFSNVDKLSEASEYPVLLCNYVDVYKNEKIHCGIDFMQATANTSEIKKFKIKKGDVLITKDSESVNDIAVPALVVEDFENVLCGYHLAQIKTQKELAGEYLFRLFQSKDFNQNFEASASGMTRYGLSVHSIKNVIIPIPSLFEQQQITDFLDYKMEQCDRFIVNRQKQIELLNEQKASIINKAVTKGINPNVKMKASGIEWIGDIPEHWEIIKLKYIIKTMASGVSVNSTDEPAKAYEYGILKTSCVYTGEFNPDENKKILENEYERMSCPVKANTIIISRMNTPELVGANAFVDEDYDNLFLPDRLDIKGN